MNFIYELLAFVFCAFHSDSEITATPILDNPHLILLFYLAQLFLRELVRSYHLLKIIPMDMSGYFGKPRHFLNPDESQLNELSFHPSA